MLVDPGVGLSAACLAGQDDRIGQRADAEIGQQLPGVLDAVTDQRDERASGPQDLQERDRIFLQARRCSEQLPILTDELAHQARPQPDAASVEDLLEPLGHCEPTAREIGPEPGEGLIPGLRLDASDHWQLVPEDFEVARQDRLVHIDEECFRPGLCRVGGGWAHEPTLSEQAPGYPTAPVSVRVFAGLSRSLATLRICSSVTERIASRSSRCSSDNAKSHAGWRLGVRPVCSSVKIRPRADCVAATGPG